jgi:dephospho-CoA kinase
MKYACQEAGACLTGKYPPATMMKMETRSGKDKPFVIGLTGTIGTGKSLVLSMLRHLGVLALDADWLAQRSYRIGRAGYEAILAHFGKGILATGGEIDRGKLGALVFGDDFQLQKLEMLIHPIVSTSINDILQHPPLPIITVEAIKLFESGLADICDQVWVVNASREVVFKRLREKRGLSASEIEERSRHQSGISERMDQADTVIQNNLDAKSLWKTVSAEWKSLTKKNTRFAQAVNLSDSLLSTSKKHLLLPGKKNTEKLTAQFQKGSVEYFNKNIVKRNLSSEDIFLLLCAYPTWLFPTNQKEDGLTICRMRHQETEIIAASSLENLHETEILHILSIIKGYSRLQLHERIILPFKGEASLLEGVGYLKIPCDKYVQEISGSLGEYNIYIQDFFPLPSGLIKKDNHE